MDAPAAATLIAALGEQDARRARQAATELIAFGPAIVPGLIEAIGSRTGMAAAVDALVRRFDGPGRLDDRPPSDPLRRRIENVLFALGPAAIPALAQAFDHPQRRVRHAIARVLAKHGEAALTPLLAALRQPRPRYPAGDALTAIGAPAVQPLVDLLCAEPAGTATWHAADAALCGIVKAQTRKDDDQQRSAIRSLWAIALEMAAAAAGLGLWAELGFGVALGMGLVTGYVSWTVAVVGAPDTAHTGCIAGLFLLRSLFSAPFEYRKKVAQLAILAVERERLQSRFKLPA
jgi:HEAT repeat protein